MTALSPAERQRILAALQTGRSQNAVAKEFGRSPGTVWTIAHQAGLEYSAPKNLATGRVDYCLENRLKLINEFFDKTREILLAATSPDDVKNLCIALGILVDKRRLEDGQSSAIVETRSADTRERLAGRVDELAARRGAPPAPRRAV